ncbi:hypothetical protein [Reyranella sp.]|uniref:hypothetical protein n=1 Tax=Reyranella sp. TaxID=1929291 RepID=UPI003D0A24F3
MKSITDRAEVAIDFPDKAYMGAFGRESSFDVTVEPDEVLLRIVRPGEGRREIAVHLHYYLLADVLKELGQGLAKNSELDENHFRALCDGAEALVQSLKGNASRRSHGGKDLDLDNTTGLHGRR